jgi:hypothetical protein
MGLMEHFRDEAGTAENQERQVELTSKFTDYAPLVLTRHEARMRRFYSVIRPIDEETASVPESIAGQQVLPIPEFTK